jgi:hypothetical protein
MHLALLPFGQVIPWPKQKAKLWSVIRHEQLAPMGPSLRDEMSIQIAWRRGEPFRTAFVKLPLANDSSIKCSGHSVEHLGLRVAFGALRPKPRVEHLGLRVAFGALRPKPRVEHHHGKLAAIPGHSWAITQHPGSATTSSLQRMLSRTTSTF